MKPTKTTLMILSIIASINFLKTNIASADYSNRNSRQVNYDLIVDHSHDLEYIAAELKDCYRDQFRGTPLYGKLVSRSAKLKNQSHRLHRYGTSHYACQWNDEIQRLDDLVCELRDYTNESIYRSRYDRPLCSIAVRTVRKLLSKAELHVRSLQQAVHFTHRPIRPAYNEPVYQRPVYREQAPVYAPPKTDLHSRVNRAPYYQTRNRQTKNIRTPYGSPYGSNSRTNHLSNYRTSSGLTFNLGGLKLRVN